MQGVWNRIHHRNSIDKILAICAIAVLPRGNDLWRGIKQVKKLTLTRAGGMVTAKKNSSPRVYNDDGTYHYPPDLDNILQKKGQDYFENWEITGSKDSKGGKRKFALTKWVRDIFFEALREYCQLLERDLNMKIHVRGQWDNASPHTDRLLLCLIAELFDEHGWVWTMQPANSPLTNILDAAIFPALAKMVSAYQGLLAGGRYLQCEMLWKMVEKAWDEYPVEKIARAFVHHSQVAAAIYNCDGGDEFVQEGNGLSFGVRKVCCIDYGNGTRVAKECWT